LEEMGQTLFKEWFGKYKVEDELPDGWKWWELWEIWDQITERVKHEKERVVLSAVNSWNLVLSESYFSKQVFSEDIAKYIICNKWDFAYNPARINIGSIWRNFYWNWAVSPVYVVFRPKEKFWKYLEYIFKSERFKNHVEKYANWSVRQALNYDWFSRFELLIPNNDILEKFNENLEVFEKKIEENKKQTETLSNTRDQLLPKLMSWEVRV
jgi:type I restriction enzyme S subunit